MTTVELRGGLSRGRSHVRAVGTAPIDVQLRAQWVENVGYRYDVILQGEVIVSRSRDPEYEAARVLQARGLRGRLQTIDFVTGKPRMVLDIEKAAKLRTVERADGGPPVLALYRPLSDDDRTRLRPHSPHQGRVFRDRAVRRTGQRTETAGGETGAASRHVLEDA